MSGKRSIFEDAQLKRFVSPLLFSLAVCYLAFHALNGDRGLYAYLKQSRHLESSQEELQSLVAKREELENRVHLMSSESLDLDLLDEQARRVLGSAGENEIVILLDVPR